MGVVFLAVPLAACGLLSDPPASGPASSSTTTASLIPSTTITATAATATTATADPTVSGSTPPGTREPGGLVLLRAEATGAAVVSGGDPDGAAKVIITSDANGDEACFSLMATSIAKVDALHVHEGVPGAEGPVVFDLTTASTGSERGCVTLSRSVLDRVAASPAAFYVDIHTADRPSGALRGQLSG